MRFFTSYEIEQDWDFMFVEAHEVRSDDWTTLPDANDKTSTVTGDSCAEGWVEQLHPFLAHYQGADCSPAGNTGSWNAATGSSGGGKEFVVDLSGYAGKQVEVSITYASDWSTQGLGVFLDDARVLVDGSTVAETSFGSADLGGWTVAGPPPGSAGNANDWSRGQQALEECSVVVTGDTVYLGFGLECLPPAARDDLVARSLTPPHRAAPPLMAARCADGPQTVGAPSVYAGYGHRRCGELYGCRGWDLCCTPPGMSPRWSASSNGGRSVTTRR
ncbi:hypothetical protein IW249_003897 [Micromonospora vinacea]|uniref:Uncharacterized protein n=1 Tax=Micromonospora vinacea TaxID=709878 RepID=A0ABS0K4A4_9ACTN|nr:hypothetical protein [Micromonospora vinacea]